MRIETLASIANGVDFVSVVVRDGTDAIRLLQLDHLDRLDEPRVLLDGYGKLPGAEEISALVEGIPVGWCAWRSSARAPWAKCTLPREPIWRFRFEVQAGAPAAERGAYVDAWIRSPDEPSALELAWAELEDGLSPAVLLERLGSLENEPGGKERLYYWQALFDGVCYVVHTWAEG